MALSLAHKNGPNMRPIFWMVMLAGMSLLIRWPALQNGGFHNEDVAGITYNADLLLNHFKPLVDNVEYKAPGSFFLSALAFHSFGRSLVTLQWCVFLLSLAAAFGIFRLVSLLYDARRGGYAAFLYIVLSPITDSMDANYGAWMIAPYVWSAVYFITALRRTHLRYLIYSGCLLALAGLIKRQAAVLVVVYVVTLLMAPRVRRPEGWYGVDHVWRCIGALVVGLLIGFTPILIWYLSHGELWTFCEQYFFSSSGWRYLKGQLSLGEQLLRLGDGFQGLWAYLATPTLLASFTLFQRCQNPKPATVRTVFVAMFLAMSFIGAALGLRFFKGYYLQVLPALLTLAVHPSGLFRKRGLQRIRPALNTPLNTQIWIFVGMVFFSLPALVQDMNELSKIRKMRTYPRDKASKKIGTYIAGHSLANDQIWVWGRWAWPIYFYADRRAASRFPKSLGIFTTTLTNTWRRPTKNTAFEPRSPWRDLMRQLRDEPPAFVVISKNEDMRSFTALRAFLKSKYQPVDALRTRAFDVFIRRTPPM